jgi:hypothetical protein
MNAHWWKPFDKVSKGAHIIHYVGNSKGRLMRDINGRELVKAQLHIITAGCTTVWALERMANLLKQYAPKGMVITEGTTPRDEPGVINYYNNYRRWKGKSDYAADVVLYTHPEEMPLWDAAMQCDKAITINQQYTDMLIDAGMHPDKVQYIKMGGGEQDCRLRVFMPTRMHAYVFNRKGISLYRRLLELDYLDVTCSEGVMSADQVEQEYQRCDCVVSTATMEGGPLSCLEALGRGIPYYGRQGVGIHDELDTVIAYHNDDDLIDLLYHAYKRKQWHHDSVQDYTWRGWANQHWHMLQQIAMQRGWLCGNPTEAIINETKAKRGRRVIPFVRQVKATVVVRNE